MKRNAVGIAALGLALVLGCDREPASSSGAGGCSSAGRMTGTVADGETAPVNAVCGWIGQAGEAVPETPAAPAPAAVAAPADKRFRRAQVKPARKRQVNGRYVWTAARLVVVLGLAACGVQDLVAEIRLQPASIHVEHPVQVLGVVDDKRLAYRLAALRAARAPRPDL